MIILLNNVYKSFIERVFSVFNPKVVELLHQIVVLLQKLRFIQFIAPKEINGSIFESTKSQNINCLKFTKWQTIQEES